MKSFHPNVPPPPQQRTNVDVRNVDAINVDAIRVAALETLI